MQQRRGFQGIAGGLGIGLLLVLAGCSRNDPEQAVRAQLDVLQQAIDSRDASAVSDLLAEDFVGNDGLDRRGARQLAVGIFLRHRQVGARLGPVTVEQRGERDAIARFSVLATGGSGGLLPEQGQVYRVETGWHLIDGEWKLRNASWTPSNL